MKERPILFSGEMVKAILEDKKTQTRRVIKPQPVQDPDRSWRIEMHPRSGYNSERTMRYHLPNRCPYGESGDRLWVRETWAGDEFTGYAYKATEPDALPFGEEVTFTKWRPAIHMPRSASRITLEVVNVRVERVQQILPGEAIAEGIKQTVKDAYFGWFDYTGNGQNLSPLMSFQSLWDSINEKRGYGWDVNPWVWVIEFKKGSS